ncbi:glycosyltransferase [Pontibaca methylaminivorans]|uniref:Glycosyltransferase involved in cell wall bisynthesis n=1 Tax=Pontibaca methylaminivorans TaxID=515897 RepID=A0A1R3X837_9RHOB|nr:glycosyltransferase [Pontibaca methylaminivorans]SIT87120.1 Glycosyltransferase involved in cell wall bisynthesis [Pontibaca methylaminivorans]
MQHTLLKPHIMNATPVTAPRVAVVVPIFRHSVLLSEAIESALAQRAGFRIQLVLVNDGCPHPETDEVCHEYALSYPDHITYLRKPNGGLSDARNHGIRHALSTWPSVEAIYMLDADNRLRPDAMSNAMAALDRHPETGWIYPNIDMFGLPWAGDYGGDYSLLIHTVMNVCEAGSLIRREVFEAGVYFDTSFKSGFEDWDFFLTAAEAGFRGRHIENFGFLYRKRAESMLADSERDSDAIRSEMRKKHKKLFSPRGLLELEQQEAPRYAIFLADRGEVLLTVDPDVPDARRISMAEFERLWWRTQTDNSQHHMPPILLMTHSAVLDQLRRARLLHAVLWTMERRLAQQCFAALEIEPRDAERIGWNEQEAQDSTELHAAMLMVRPGLFSDIVRDSSIAWASGVAARPCALPTTLLRLQLPETLFSNGEELYTAAAHDFVGVAARYQASPNRDALAYRWDWRTPDVPWRGRTHEISRIPTKADAAYPRISRDGRDIGFALPLAEFGGVERVALNTARAMKRAGWRPHLFILEAQSCQFSAEWRDTFESVTFLADPTFMTWGPANSNYLGTDVPDWSRSGDQRQATAMLAWLDAVINFHGGAISGVMGQLKRFGVKTALSLHLSDLSTFQRPVGNTYLGLAFEHAYDAILPCSRQLGEWCHAMGIPADKIVPILNAPSFDLPEEAEARLDARRATRSPQDPLRVMYLGRLDQQKGIERLVSIIETTQALRLPIEWRLIGRAVISDSALELPPQISSLLEPPLTTPEGLEEAFEWADVFILPSYYEGLPLTILEAMRSGVIPIATDAGAVTEVLHQWVNGVVLSQSDTISEALTALERLASDPALVRQLSSRARTDMEGRNWNNAVKPFIERFEQLRESRT